ncbi:hypothetical protein Godav_000890 [Gossypium davidsonii]|uniref:Uncharacterized protein n=1 Tax=Gossypium davidsonii TaxID=34287 RepID=A0A7J8T209_GOSDV|nr:hypothetical protein [Gossypium davidsonii]
MEKPIPKVGSHKNGCSSARKSTSRIPKGVIQVQASFNNTIVILTDVWGWVISWSSIDTCGFNGIRKGTPCASQTEVGNAIRAVVDQGQADTIGSAMRRALLGELEGTCITCAKSEKIPHEYSTIVGQWFTEFMRANPAVQQPPPLVVYLVAPRIFKQLK